ncbi:acyl-CoA dehydrogenase, partial [Mycobacterium sp. ITM-2017-0098]
MSADLAPALEDVLRPVLGEITVENLQRLTGGASRTTWA